MDEHQMLKMDEGVWDAKITLLSRSDGEPAHYDAKETNTMIGELWSIGTLEIPELDYSGFATLGYDPAQQQYIGTWIDSSTPSIVNMSGTYDQETKTLTLFYTTYGENGQAIERKNVMVYTDESTRDYVMYVKGEDGWDRSMEILYKRTGP